MMDKNREKDESEFRPMIDLALNFDQTKHISLYENWLFHVQWQHQLHVLTCIIEVRCDSKPFDGLLQIDYDFLFSTLFAAVQFIVALFSLSRLRVIFWPVN